MVFELDFVPFNSHKEKEILDKYFQLSEAAVQRCS